MIQFFMPMVPPTVTAQEHRVAVVGGRPRFYDGKRLKEARETLCASLAPHKPEAPLSGPLLLIEQWAFPGRSRKHFEFRATKPDTDNLTKLLKDCMTRCGFWEDDAQVAVECVSKVWTRHASGLHICIDQLDQCAEPMTLDLPFTDERSTADDP